MKKIGGLIFLASVFFACLAAGLAVSFRRMGMMKAEEISGSVWDAETSGSVVLSQTQEIDLDIQCSDGAASLNTSGTATLELAEAEEGFGEIQSIKWGDVDLGSSLTVPVSGFGYAYGKQYVTIAARTESGAEHEAILPVLLISKKISDKTEFDAMPAISAACESDPLVYGGCFILDNNISYGGAFAGVVPASLTDTEVQTNGGGFKGSFDGRGYTVDGLEINRTGSDVPYSRWANYYGVFGVLCGGEVKNVSFTNAKIHVKGSFVSSYGSGLIENVYVSYASVTPWAETDTNVIGTFFSHGLKDGAVVRNCVVDLEGTSFVGKNGESYSAPYGCFYAIGAYNAGRNVLQSVHVTGNACGAKLVGGQASASNVYASYKDAAAFCADSIVQREIRTWNTDFWKITGGVPYGKYADSSAPVETDIDVELDGNGQLVSGKQTTIELSSVATDFGVFVSAAYNGTNLGAVYAEGNLTAAAEKFGFDYGEQKISVTFAKAGREYTFEVAVLLITKKLSDAAELNAMPTISKACEEGNFYGGYFVLDNDIAWTGASFQGIGYGLSDSVVSSKNSGFKGVIDGRGYAIDGLYTGGGWNNYEGLVGVLRGGVIKNLAFTNAKLRFKGGFVCGAGTGTVQNVYVGYSVFGAISQTDGNWLGTFFGRYAEDGAKVIDCIVDFTGATITDNGKSYAIGSVVCDMLEGVYAIGTPATVKLLDNGTDTGNIYGSYTDATAFAQAYNGENSVLKAEIDGWDRKYWTVGNGTIAFSPDGGLPAGTFVRDAKTDYVLICGLGDEIAKAATFIRKHILAATGAELRTVSATGWSENEKYIVVGDRALFENSGLDMPEGKTCYVRTYGNQIFIMALNPADYQLAAIAFLRETIGYEAFSDDLVIYEKTGAALPTIDFGFIPAFDVRLSGTYMSGEAKYEMGFSLDVDFGNIDGEVWHNSLKYLPYETYAAAHPGWYTGDLDPDVSGDQRQLCYTAHGNASELQAMKQALFEKLWNALMANPAWSRITITQEDNHYSCNCSTCTGYSKASVPVILFMNDIDAMLRARFQQENIEREVQLYFFAYHGYEEAPTDGTKCNPNVGVVIAPITADFTKGLSAEVNQSVKTNIENWTNVSDRIYLWLYEMNFWGYFYPYNTWDSVADWYKTADGNNVTYIYNEGVWYQGAVSAFTKLKIYLDSRMQADVNLDADELIDKFFEYYYGQAGEVMRTLYEEMQEHLAQLAIDYPSVADGGCHERINNKFYWPEALLQTWIGYIQEAYEELDASDPNYEIYRRHILLESISPRYIYATLYNTNLITKLTMKSFCQELKKDCQAFGIEYWAANRSMSEWYDAWGV